MPPARRVEMETPREDEGGGAMAEPARHASAQRMVGSVLVVGKAQVLW
jgi:hypothetical protein